MIVYARDWQIQSKAHPHLYQIVHFLQYDLGHAEPQKANQTEALPACFVENCIKFEANFM